MTRLIRFFCVYIHERRCLEVIKPDGSVVLRDLSNVSKLEVDLND